MYPVARHKPPIRPRRHDTPSASLQLPHRLRSHGPKNIDEVEYDTDPAHIVAPEDKLSEEFGGGGRDDLHGAAGRRFWENEGGAL